MVATDQHTASRKGKRGACFPSWRSSITLSGQVDTKESSGIYQGKCSHFLPRKRWSVLPSLFLPTRDLPSSYHSTTAQGEWEAAINKVYVNEHVCFLLLGTIKMQRAWDRLEPEWEPGAISKMPVLWRPPAQHMDSLTSGSSVWDLSLRAQRPEIGRRTFTNAVNIYYAHSCKHIFLINVFLSPEICFSLI